VCHFVFTILKGFIGPCSSWILYSSDLRLDSSTQNYFNTIYINRITYDKKYIYNYKNDFKFIL